MSAPHQGGLIAKLPLLGPVIGWTRRGPGGELLTRCWIRADDVESEPPVAVLTAVFDRHGVRRGSVQAWKLVRIPTLYTRDQHGLLLGLADVALPTADDCRLRMVSLHRTIRSDSPLLSLVHDAHIDAGSLKSMWRSLRGARAGRLPGQARLDDVLPRPSQVSLGNLMQGRVQGDAEHFAESLIAGLQEAIEQTNSLAAQPIPPTLSRRRLRVRRLDECEAALSAATREQIGRDDGRVVFAVGSCRHPGTAFERERSGWMLEALAAAAARPDGPAFAILTGDQIYADATGGVFDVESRYEKFVTRYEAAFGATAFRVLASQLPLYMAADDHEIGDGWSLARTRAINVRKEERAAQERAYEWGRRLFYAHQRLHGPDEPVRGPAWYCFEAAGVPFFVMDTRFERAAHAPGVSPWLINEAQQQALLHWLDWLAGERATMPKFIVSGAVFAPGMRRYADDPPAARAADNWQGFPRERAWLAQAIAVRGLQNVVFLSGDYHCAAVGALKLFDDAGGAVTAYAVVSPPLFAPYPFANARADEICIRETIRDPAGNRLVASCDASAAEGEGFALIRILRNAGWTIELELCRATPQADREVYLRARLAEGRVTLLTNS